MKIDLKIPDKIFGLDKSLLLLFLPPIVLILVFFISLNLILIPKTEEIEIVSDEIAKVNESTNNLNEQISYLQSIDQQELQRNSEYLDNAVLKDKKSYLLVQIIREVANKFDFQVESFSLAPGEIKKDEIETSKLENMIKMPVSLMLFGPENKSLDLILALEKTLPVLFIDKYEISSSQGVSKLNLMVSSYYMSGEISINTDKIALNDLTLSKDEAELVKKISSFTKIEENKSSIETSEFQRYQRENPFSL